MEYSIIFYILGRTIYKLYMYVILHFEVELNKNCSVISQNVKLHVVYFFLKCKIIWSTP